LLIHAHMKGKRVLSKASAKAYAIIRQRIIDGALAPGERLKEEDLASLCGVSRTPIRDALRSLAADLFVTVVPNHGAYVNDWSPDDVEDIFTMRGMLEGYAAQRAASRITEEELDIMQASADAIEVAIANPDEPDVETFLAANRTLHETLRQAANSTRLNTMLGQLVEMPVVIRTATSYTPGDLRRSNDHHQELIDALRAGDGTWAEAKMVAHIHAAYQQYRRAYQPPEG